VTLLCEALAWRGIRVVPEMKRRCSRTWTPPVCKDIFNRRS
jgi:hypothetical protein